MLKEFAQKLNQLNLEYGYPVIPKEIVREAEEKGIVIVYGMSDDLIEIEGAITDEGDCFEGGIIYISEEGIVEVNTVNCAHHRFIKAKWCDTNVKDENGTIITWTYESDIPHETFMVYDEGEPYCRGIVFNMSDVYSN